MSKILSAKFFNRNTVQVARELLGKKLVLQNTKGACQEAFITEVEAYHGIRDRASHASRGRTSRNAPMFDGPGRWYVYLVYGMYWMLNVTTLPRGEPGAVLIRGLIGVNGPGKLTKRWDIDKKFNTLSASRATGLWIEDEGVQVPPNEVIKTPRIGVAYAGKWAEKLWRFVWKRDENKP